MATCSKCSTFYVTAINCPKDGAALLDDESARNQGIVPIAAERYALQSMLGEGGMGVVYLAIHRELGRNVAIKILRKEGQNAQSLERFKREAQASSLINHRNVVSILDFGELPDQSLFIVMEHLEGKSLADAIDNEGPFSVERTLRIAVQLAKGLAAAHEKKVIHRDLKPDNIFLINTQDFPDVVKILDFRHPRLYVSRTSHRTTRRSPRRCLRRGNFDLRDADRPTPLYGRVLHPSLITAPTRRASARRQPAL
jgi:serine/threonine protein kinase